MLNIVWDKTFLYSQTPDYLVIRGVCVCVCVQPTACYKPSQTAQYTEDSDWTPFDLLSRLVKEWEAAGRLPEDIAQKTKQVVIRPGTVWNGFVPSVFIALKKCFSLGTFDFMRRQQPSAAG